MMSMGNPPSSTGYNYTIILARPAAGVWTFAHDFARYVQLELNLGKLSDGRQLVSQEIF